MTNHKKIKNASRKSKKWNRVYKRDILPTLPSIEDLHELSFVKYISSQTNLSKDIMFNKKNLKTSPSTRRLAKTGYSLFSKLDFMNNLLSRWSIYSF